jgi:hypothetical protein
MKKALATDPTTHPTVSLTVPDLLRVIQTKDQLLVEREALIKEQQKLLRLMEEQLRLARLRRFDASSEKLSFQGTLFDEAELEVSLKEVETQLPEEEKRPAGKSRQADGYSKRLPRIQVHLSLSEEERVGASKTFYTKVKEELDIVPAQAQVIEYWQEKAVFEDSEEGAPRSRRRSVRSIPWANARPASSYWPGSWWPNMPMPCRCTGSRASSNAMGAGSVAPPWPTGSSAWAMSSNHCSTCCGSIS